MTEGLGEREAPFKPHRQSDCLESEVALVFIKAFVPRRRQTA